MRVLAYLVGALLLVVAVAVGVITWMAREPAIASIATPDPASLDTALVDRGEVLAGYGDCLVCHTAPGGKPYAGGLSFETPFGTVYSSNISPDPETGIGTWSEEAFRRAMHEGVDREGNHLYPVFPFDHFARVTDVKDGAIYAYLMTQPAVNARPPASELRFPYGFRPLMAGWKLLFLSRGAYQPDPAHDEAWNRGAYLVQGLGHCGSCHAARNFFGAEADSASLDGGVVEGWHAPALGANSPAPVPWTEDALVNYLLDGWDENHGIAAGPMMPVVNQLAELEEDDAYAMATYLVSLQEPGKGAKNADAAIAFAEEQAGATPAMPAGDDPGLKRGQATFERICANCHKAEGTAATQPAPLALATTVAGPDPGNAIRIILGGIRPPSGVPERAMPAFTALGNDELVDLVRYLRARFSRGPAWTDVEARVAAIRPAKS